MPLNDRRLTGRDVLAKTFQQKTKRGYDPIEVDAYLELVAAQIDVLHGDLAQANNESAQAVAVAPDPAIEQQHQAVEQQNQELLSELATLRSERDEYAQQVTQYAANEQALRSENDQLRNQLTSVAPPPPLAAEPEPVAAVVDASDERATDESYELVLRMARRSAEETIAEAHGRADEIVAEANLTASQITKESDRKAYEAANKVQADLAQVNSEIESQQSTLRHLQTHTANQRVELRDLAQKILNIADDDVRRFEGAEVVDLRDTATVTDPAL